MKPFLLTLSTQSLFFSTVLQLSTLQLDALLIFSSEKDKFILFISVQMIFNFHFLSRILEVVHQQRAFLQTMSCLEVKTGS